MRYANGMTETPVIFFFDHARWRRGMTPATWLLLPPSLRSPPPPAPPRLFFHLSFFFSSFLFLFVAHTQKVPNFDKRLEFLGGYVEISDESQTRAEFSGAIMGIR